LTCQKSYMRDTHLHAHQRMHLPDSDRPYVCSEGNCSKRFWTSQHLRVHTETHQGEKPFKVHNSSIKSLFHLIIHHSAQQMDARKHSPSTISLDRIFVPFTHPQVPSRISALTMIARNPSPPIRNSWSTLKFTKVTSIRLTRLFLCSMLFCG
jgi:hypothetical protein